MKTFFISLLLILCHVSVAIADNVIVPEVEIPKGSTAVMAIELNNTEYTYSGVEFNLTLPAGVNVAEDENGKFIYAKGERLNGEDFTLSMSWRDTYYKILGYYTDASPIPGTSGAVALITLQADASLEIGTILQATLGGICLSTPDVELFYPADIVFNIKIVDEPIITLDEADTVLPTATNREVKLNVVRTINANEWSPLCLPFAMTQQQLYEVFGNDVQVAEFISYDVDDENNPTTIDVNFETNDLTEGFYANYPYIIKTSHSINSFSVTAKLEPNEEDAVAEYAVGRGKNRHVYGTFIGTLKAGTTLPSNTLFMNNNKFYYSQGSSTMLAFRAYFDFEDVLPHSDTNANVNLIVDGQTTNIDNLQLINGNSLWYTIDGRRLNGRPTQKGIYIHNNRKKVLR